MACLPVNQQWFWKQDYPSSPVKSSKTIIESNLMPLNRAYCNFILNVAPNRQGLIDDNALALLKEIGERWKPEGKMPILAAPEPPIISPISPSSNRRVHRGAGIPRYPISVTMTISRPIGNPMSTSKSLGTRWT